MRPSAQTWDLVKWLLGVLVLILMAMAQFDRNSMAADIRSHGESIRTLEITSNTCSVQVSTIEEQLDRIEGKLDVIEGDLKTHVLNQQSQR